MTKDLKERKRKDRIMRGKEIGQVGRKGGENVGGKGGRGEGKGEVTD
jgi:hypothetical protein